ncbi:Protein of unknown function [Palleronia pelagia]|uniref:Surface lipoprotein assembly modifier C-terminal domain-containing protein n=1 Tax=Palleronia pelagia TaxID=387096 RepID=A0A1H8GRT0_9RHOB|nr:Protein of unknown function [Palleronia pelagia]
MMRGARLPPSFRRATLALLAALALAGPVAAEPAALNPDQMRVAAGRATASGQPLAAKAMAEALLARDRDDIQALLALSRAERDLGDYDAARDAGMRAWSLGRRDEDRYAAALAVAQAQASKGARTRSQFWLRRAVEVAPDDRAEARAIRDYRYVRARNPWATQLSFTLAPSSNVNGGTSNETADLYLSGTPIGDLYLPDAQLGPTARALSGVELALGVSASRRLHETATEKTTLDMGLLQRSHILSDEAKRMAPTASGSDFAYSAATLGMTHKRKIDDGRGDLRFGLATQRTWYGGDTLAQSVRASAAVGYALTPKTKGQLSLSADRENGLNGRADVTGWRLGAGVGRVTDSGLQLSAAISHSDRDSASGALDFRETEITLGAALPEPVMGAQVSFSLSAADRHHDSLPFALNGRDDKRLAARATMAFPALDYMGFVPDVTVEALKNSSTVDLYDRREFGVSLGVRSRF